MELESLKRQISFLENSNIKIKKLVTDRHTQVSAYMANEKPNIQHTYDFWHIAKGMVIMKTKLNYYFSNFMSLLQAKRKK